MRNREIMHESICIQFVCCVQPLSIHASHAMAFIYFREDFEELGMRKMKFLDNIVLYLDLHTNIIFQVDFHRISVEWKCLLRIPNGCDLWPTKNALMYLSSPRITFRQNQKQHKKKTKCIHYIVVVVSMGFLCEEFSARANSPVFSVNFIRMNEMKPTSCSINEIFFCFYFLHFSTNLF